MSTEIGNAFRTEKNSGLKSGLFEPKIGLKFNGTNATPGVGGGHTGKCGLYGWICSRSKICRYGYILESVPMSVTEGFHQKTSQNRELSSRIS